jgi:glycosyltransferase involved in cell wall biosynthesis
LENCPLVIQEALSADTPIIASNIGGIPEFIKDGINGLLFRPSDADDLRAKMQLLIDSPQTIDALRRNIRKPTGIEGNAVSIENIYLDLTAALKS